MARGRTFELRTADGQSLPLTKENGFWVQEGVTGLGKPIYDIDDDSSSDVPGVTFYGARAASRQVFLPMDITAPDRATLLVRKQLINQMLDPVNEGAGYLYITDANGTWRLQCHYADGLSGDESRDLAGESNAEHWQRVGLVLQCVDPYFENPTDQVSNWGYSGTVPFFPIMPVKLNPGQVLSDASQPVTNNWMRNPSAETNVNFWDTVWFFGAPTTVITQDASLVPPNGGAFSIKCQSPNNTSQSGPSQITDTTLTIGVVYTAHCWVYVPGGNADARLVIDISPQSGNMTIKDQWVWMSLTFTASATQHRLTVLPPVGVDGSNWLVYVDKFAISEGVITNPADYIDGDQLNCHWTGTAHNSSSYRDATYAPTHIVNPGTVAAYPVWTVVGPGSQADFYNKVNGRRLRLTYTLATGQVAIFDCANGNVKLADGTSLYRYLDNDDFFPLLPGDNSVTATLIGAAAGSSITLRFKPRLEALV